MIKKLASIAVAGTLALCAAVPAPALAQDAPQLSSGEQFGQSARSAYEGVDGDPLGQLQGMIALSAMAPFMLSSVALTALGFEQCGLHDVRGCEEG